ncbi:MAG: metallophosphoesterase [Polyangiaceae bacterium]
MPLSRILVGLVVVIAVTSGVHWYLWSRLVRDAALPAPWFRVLTVAMIVLAASLPVALLASRGLPRFWGSLLAWPAYVWMGVMFFLFVALVPLDLARGLWTLVPSGDAAVDPARRTFLARVASGMAALVATSFAGVGLASVLRDVAVKRVPVTLARLPKHLSGYTIVQLTDIHVGPTIGKDFIEQLVASANALQPDMIAITGDLVDGSVAALGAFVEPLRNLRAKDGVYFVTGNHEYYSGAPEWIAFLGTLGIRVLRNEHVRIRGDEGFDLAGVDDATAHQFGLGHGMDMESVNRDRDRERLLVLLAHQPKAIVTAEPHGVDLQLSGHTHGGQLFPFNFLVKLQQPYVAGLYEHGRAKVYVSAGTGYWGPPMRVGAPAEITRIELVSGSA